MRLHISLDQVHVLEAEKSATPVTEYLAIAHHRLEPAAQSLDIVFITVSEQLDQMLETGRGFLLVDQGSLRIRPQFDVFIYTYSIQFVQYF